MKSLIVIGLGFFLSLNAFSTDITFDNKGDLKSMIENIKNSQNEIKVPEYKQENKDLKEWTVMVFVNSKNNLESYGLKDVNEMEIIGSSDKVNIVAELGRISGYSSEDGDWKGSRRYLVQKDNDTKKINSPILMEILKSDMGDWNHLVEFINWSKEKFPAKKYALVVWNHGSGWNKNLEFSEIGKGISYDDETHNHITTAQLKLAMDKVNGVNVFAMDACLMQMVEVAYEIKDKTSFIVASEETEPGDGYTYDTWLSPLVAKPTMSDEDLSKVMVDSYSDHYISLNQGATQSSIRSNALKEFTNLLNNFIDSLMASNEVSVAKTARDSSQAFYYRSNKDMYHFVSLVVNSTKNNEVKAKGNTLLNFMKNNLIVHNKVSTSKYNNAYGLAGYLPSAYTSSYDELLWAKDSKWDEMMKWIK